MNPPDYKVFVPIQEAAKGFAERNRLELKGEPLWRRCLRRFEGFSVFVDTDSPELAARIRNEEGLRHAEVYERAEALRRPGTSVNDLIRGFLDRFAIRHEPVVQIHVTTPFLDPASVRRACERVTVDSQYDSAVSCQRVRKRLWRKEPYGFCPVNHNPLDLQPSAVLPEFFVENSCFYVFLAENFRRTSNRVGFRPWFEPLGFPEYLEVRTSEDWELTKLAAEQLGR